MTGLSLKFPFVTGSAAGCEARLCRAGSAFKHAAQRLCVKHCHRDRASYETVQYVNTHAARFAQKHENRMEVERRRSSQAGPAPKEFTSWTNAEGVHKLDQRLRRSEFCAKLTLPASTTSESGSDCADLPCFCNIVRRHSISKQMATELRRFACCGVPSRGRF